MFFLKTATQSKHKTIPLTFGGSAAMTFSTSILDGAMSAERFGGFPLKLKCLLMKLALPKIIQGGMGIHVSSWRLAKAVSVEGQLGVVSGTAIDAVVARVLQLGDKEGCIRRALEHFPFPEMAQRVKDRFFVEGGKDGLKPFKGIGMPSLDLSRAKTELLIVSNFVEVFLAKEGHDGVVGINYLEKIQIPTLPSLFGAMLAGVNVVLMGAGIPTAIPGVLDGLADWQPVSLKLNVEDNPENAEFNMTFDPREFAEGTAPKLDRPDFLAIVSTDIVAKSMERRAVGVVDGYVIENYNAGGHNAPPRKDRTQPADAEPYFGEKDDPNLDKIRALGKPFWLAGKFTSQGGLKNALAEGAQGLQVGTHFAFCDESGIQRDIKDEVIHQSLAGTMKVETSFVASPTGYPFKLARLSGDQFTVESVMRRQRVCDMGYLRTAYVDDDQKLAWRCPAEPVEDYVRKGGDSGRTQGSLCLCNGLAGTVGLGQNRKGASEAPILTTGEEALQLAKVIPEGQSRYTAKHVIDYLLS